MRSVAKSSTWAPRALRPPSPQLRWAAQLLDEGNSQLLAARSGLDRALGQFESTHDGLNLLYLCIRQIDGVVVTAAYDAVLWPAAITAARGAFESGVRSLWMVDADDPFEREGRWLGFLDSDVEARGRFARRADADAMATESSVDQLTLAKHFRTRHDDIKRLLANKGRKPVSVPKFDAMMKATRVRTSYAHYVHSSQYAHGTLWATWAFRGEDWASRSGRESRDERAWSLALQLCAAALLDPAPRVLKRLGVSTRIFRKNYATQLERAIAAVRASG